MKETIMRVINKTATAKDYVLFVVMVMVAYAILKVSLTVISVTLSISLQFIFYILPFVVAGFVVVKALKKRKDK